MDQNGEQIRYDPANVYLSEHGLSRDALSQFVPQLYNARAAMLEDLALLRSGKEIPGSKQPLDAGFIDLPERLLNDYHAKSEQSEVGRILQTAADLAANVDRLVVVGIGGSYMGTRSLFEACCHPFHNELGRLKRGHRPRLYFAGYNIGNDLTQALLDMLAGADFSRIEDRWAIIVVSKSGGTLEPAIAFRQLFRRLRESTVGTTWQRKLVFPVTSEDSKLHQLAREALDSKTFFVPGDVGGRFSIFTACALLPAAVLGIDVVRLLEGAAAMTKRFREADVEVNTVLDYTGVSHLLEKQEGAFIRVLSLWDQGLEALGLWYDQLLAESLGKKELGATPITAVNTRDLHSRGQQHQDGRRDKLITNVILERPRREPVAVGTSDYDQDGLNEIASRTLPEVLVAAIRGTNQAYKEDNRPTADISLPSAGEFCLGQLYQMLMLATGLEGYLLGINPYGQPGVEAYKRHMNSALNSS